MQTVFQSYVHRSQSYVHRSQSCVHRSQSYVHKSQAYVDNPGSTHKSFETLTNRVVFIWVGSGSHGTVRCPSISDWLSNHFECCDWLNRWLRFRTMTVTLRHRSPTHTKTTLTLAVNRILTGVYQSAIWQHKPVSVSAFASLVTLDFPHSLDKVEKKSCFIGMWY